MTVSSLQLPSGPRVVAVTQVQGKESVRPRGGALKNAAPVRKRRCNWECTLNSHSKSVTGLYSNHRTKALGARLFTNFTSYANDFFGSILKFAVLFGGKTTCLEVLLCVGYHVAMLWHPITIV